MSPWRDFYWSVRREIWENRAALLAPLVVGAVALVGYLVGSVAVLQRVRDLAALDPEKQMRALAMPYGLAASVVLVTGWIAGIFYAAEALNGERRDRSILFWKSMPVSDLTTVLAKAGIPLVVLPAASMAAAFATQVAMLLASVALLAANGLDPLAVWSRVPLGTMTIIMLYGVTAHLLWFSPIFAWVLLLSAWTRRAALLWSALPFAALYAIEMLAFGKSAVAQLLQYRVTGAMVEAFNANAMHTPIMSFSQLDPVKFFSSPSLWLGLAFAAACIAGAIRARRYREPN